MSVPNDPSINTLKVKIVFVHYFTEFTLLTQIKIKPLHPVSLGRFCLVFLKDTYFTLSMKYLFVIVQALFNCILLLMMINVVEHN